MNIRMAKMNDIPAFIEIGRRAVSETRFKNFEYNEKRVEEQLKGVINNKNNDHCFLVAENSSGEAVGGLIGRIESDIFSDIPIASIVSYTVLPEKRMGGAALKLMTVFRKWAENRGAAELNAGVNSGVGLHKTDRLLKKLGFTLNGGNYSLGLSR